MHSQFTDLAVVGKYILARVGNREWHWQWWWTRDAACQCQSRGETGINQNWEIESWVITTELCDTSRQKCTLFCGLYVRWRPIKESLKRPEFSHFVSKQGTSTKKSNFCVEYILSVMGGGEWSCNRSGSALLGVSVAAPFNSYWLDDGYWLDDDLQRFMPQMTHC